MSGFVDLEHLWQGAASHVIVATALTTAAWAVARWMRRPALVHGLSVLALLALVTPPVLPVPILPAPAPAPRHALVTADLDPADLAVWLATPAPLSAAPASAVAAEALPARSGIDVTTLLLGVWLLGSLAVLSAIALRAWRFGRLLRHARAPSAGLAAEVRRLATQLGLHRAPEIAIIAARVSPMLWPAATRLVLVLPEPLLRKLTPDQRATLLLHELAHVRRRDHWVRRLETLVVVLFWWLPTLWWLRSCLRHAEEQCCDAWVVWALPESERAYADALLSTVDFLSGARFALPPQASGAGHVHQLKQRLTMIMEATTPRRLSTASRLAVVALAAVLLPVLPTQAQEKEKQGTDPELRAALERIEELERAVKKMVAAQGESIAEAVEKASEKAVDAEQLQQHIDEAVKSALRASQGWRKLVNDGAVKQYLENVKKGDYAVAPDFLRKAAKLDSEGKLEAADEEYRKALQSYSEVRVDDEKIRKAVEKALKAAKVGDSFQRLQPFVQNLETWREQNPDKTWNSEQWKKFAEGWRLQPAQGGWYLKRPRGDHDEDEAEEYEEVESAEKARSEPKAGDRDHRIQEVQDQINALQKQLKKLNGELRRLQRRGA